MKNEQLIDFVGLRLAPSDRSALRAYRVTLGVRSEGEAIRRLIRATVGGQSQGPATKNNRYDATECENQCITAVVA
jgi:hypothetical protein